MSSTIIIVDEEEELRENLQDLLEFKGYDVVTYTSGEEILDHFESVKADLVLLDFQLPGLNGIDVLIQIKEKMPSLPVALVTASSQPQTLEQASRYGVDRIVMKPYSCQEILQAVNELLQSPIAV